MNEKEIIDCDRRIIAIQYRVHHFFCSSSIFYFLFLLLFYSTCSFHGVQLGFVDQQILAICFDLDSIVRLSDDVRQLDRNFLSSGWRQASEALIAETNPAKNRIKKVTPAVEELGQPLSAAKQFTVQLSHDVVKRFLRWCTTDLLFFCSPLKMFFFSGTENRKKGSIVLPCREPISCSLFQLSGSLANCILRFIFCPTPIDSSYSLFFATSSPSLF